MTTEFKERLLPHFHEIYFEGIYFCSLPKKSELRKFEELSKIEFKSETNI